MIKNSSAHIFLVTGRLGKSLIVSKAVPFIEHPEVSHVHIFSEDPGFELDNATYHTTNGILSKYHNPILKKIARFILEPLQLIRHSKRKKPFLINGVYTLPKGLNALIAAKLTGTKSVISVIGGPVEITTHMRGTWFWKRLNLWMLRQCDAVTTKGTRVTKFLVENGVPREKIFHLNGSVDTRRFKPVAEQVRDIDLLFVGSFRPLKGPDRVLQVVENLVGAERPSLRAVFLGNGELYDEIKQSIQKKNLQHIVSLMGYEENPAPYFQRSRILMMPSVSEGLPTAMLEAMACGCVPVVSDVGNVTDAAWHQENAMVIDSWQNISAFTDAAAALLSDKRLWNKLSEQGIKTVEENYTPQKQSLVAGQILHYLNHANATLKD